MTQPKQILFETGAPKMIAAVTADGVTYLAPDDWTQVLDLREDPDQQIVRRLTLYAHRNCNTNIPDPPTDPTSAFVCVIDDSVTTGVEAILQGFSAGCALPAEDCLPVKILDDYPVRGPIRVIAGAGPQSLDPIDNVVLFGYYTIAGSEGSRTMIDRRPFQLGRTVPAVSSESASSATTAGVDFHETSDLYVDEITLLTVGPSGPYTITFGDPLDNRYLYVDVGASYFIQLLDAIPMREVGLIHLATGTDLDYVLVNGFFTRY